MKVIIQGTRIIGTATDAYVGPEIFAPMPEGFEIANASNYEYDPNTGTVVASIPKQVTMRQARLALLAAGLLTSVQTAINAIVDPMEKAAAEIEWEYALVVNRNSGLVPAMATALGLTSEQIDDLFVAANAIPD